MSSNNENKGILITQDRMAYCYAIHSNDRFVILINWKCLIVCCI